MIVNNMLDNRKPQTGSAPLLGAAFIHAVKTLKDSALRMQWNADAIVSDDDFCLLFHAADTDMHRSAGVVVFDGIVDEIDKQLPDVAFVAAQQQAGAFQLNLNLVALNDRIQNLQRTLGRGTQFHLCVQEIRVFLDFRQPDNVVDQKEQALAFPFDHSTVFLHIIFLCNHAAAEHFSKPFDGCQRCF